jgi:hypothetical protein
MRRSARPIAIGIRVEHRFHERLQVQLGDRLSDAVSDRGHAEHPHTGSRLRYLNRPDRRRHIAPRGHSVPEPVQVPREVCLELRDRLPVDPRSALVGPHLPPGLPDHPLGNHERLAVRLRLVLGLLPHWRLAVALTRMTRPLRSTRITRLHRYHGAVRPCALHRYSAPRSSAARSSPVPEPTAGPRWRHWPARTVRATGSHVPCRTPT